MTASIDLTAWPTATADAFVTCSGKTLLAQRFLLELLTEAGSIPFRSDRGTTFMSDMRSGFVRTELDVYGLFARAEAKIKRNLQAEETSTMPDDELYKSSAIYKMELAPGYVLLTIQIQSAAGSLQFPVPINIA